MSSRTTENRCSAHGETLSSLRSAHPPLLVSRWCCQQSCCQGVHRRSRLEILADSPARWHWGESTHEYRTPIGKSQTDRELLRRSSLRAQSSPYAVRSAVARHNTSQWFE